MTTRPWVIRTLLILMLAALLGLFAHGLLQAPSAVALPTPAKETDLGCVYRRLPDDCLFQNLHKWCGLRVSDATPDEAVQLRAAVEAADPIRVWCGTLDDIRRKSPP